MLSDVEVLCHLSWDQRLKKNHIREVIMVINRTGCNERIKLLGYCWGFCPEVIKIFAFFFTYIASVLKKFQFRIRTILNNNNNHGYIIKVYTK